MMQELVTFDEPGHDVVALRDYVMLNGVVVQYDLEYYNVISMIYGNGLLTDEMLGSVEYLVLLNDVVVELVGCQLIM